MTELVLNVNALIVAGFTVSVAITFSVPRVAVTVTTVCVATPAVITVNDGDVVLPAGTVTLVVDNVTVEAGTTLVMLKETMVPPAGAAWVRVTLPVAFVPPITLAGTKLAAFNIAGGGVTVTELEVTIVTPVVAVNVTLPGVPAVTRNV